MRRLLIVLFLVLLAVPVFAQGAPEQINDALASFNQRLGLNLTLDDMFWSWSQATYDDTSLGCPTVDTTYTPGAIIAFNFEFTWEGKIYEYRVSADRSVVQFCGERDENAAPDPNAAPDAEAVSLSNALCPPPSPGIVYPRTRLIPGIQARIEPGLANNFRATPDENGQLIGQIPGGAAFEVTGGPSCDPQGRIWWEVSYNNQRGWTVEGLDGDYFIEPLPPTLTNPPEQWQSIDRTTAPYLFNHAELQGNFGSRLVWSPSGRLVVLGGVGSEGAWIYDGLTGPLFDPGPRILEAPTLFTALDFSTAEGREDLALFGGADGRLRLWDIRPNAQVVERANLLGHDDPVTAVAFHPNGEQFASTGGLALTLENNPETDRYGIVLWDVNNVVQSGVLRGESDAVIHMEYQPDIPSTTSILTVNAGGEFGFWDTDGGGKYVTPVDVESPTAFIYNNRGVDIIEVFGKPDGNVVVRYKDETQTSSFNVETKLERVTTLIQHPSDRMLVVAIGTNGNVALISIPDFAPQETVPFTLLEEAHEGAVLDAAFSPDGRILATLGEDNNVILWTVFAG